MPLVSFAIEWLIVKAYRLWDRSFTCDTKRTKQPGTQAYIDFYIGPSFGMEFRRAALVSNTAIAMILGPLFPLLYPVTLLAFMVLMVHERLLIVYWCREPPTYDEKMAVTSIKILRIVPLATLFVAFWQLGNKSILDNFTQEIMTKY